MFKACKMNKQEVIKAIEEGDIDVADISYPNLEETARQVIKTYELRPEIEEDFRQLKEFWQLEEFKSTKYDHMVFHIVMLLMGYMFYQLYKNTEACSERS